MIGNLTASVQEGTLRDLRGAASNLRAAVILAVEDTLGDSILLSGGLDTSIIAAIESTYLNSEKSFKGYTVALSEARSPDLEYSILVSSKFQIPHEVCTVNLEELGAELPEVIAVLRCFDPMEIRNSVVAYIGMKCAKLDGRVKVMTGDGADELFAGYSFVFQQPEDKARESLKHLWQVMSFSSIPLAHSLGIEARLPFLNPAVKQLAMSAIDYPLLVGKRDETSREIFGKYVLRKAFEELLPAEITWRTKTPIEYGSGTTVLPQLYAKSITDEEFLAKRKKYSETDGVRLRDKEQLRYYEIFRRTIGPPYPRDRNQRKCPACTSNVPEAATFCTTCGEYPI